MNGATIGGIIAAHSTMWNKMMKRRGDIKSNVQVKSLMSIVEREDKNINRWAMGKPVERRPA